MEFIVISRCEAVLIDEKGRKEALFFYNGACIGFAITVIRVKLNAEIIIFKGREYLFYLIFDRINSGVLYGSITKDGLQLLEF